MPHLAGMIANIGERVTVVKTRTLPRKFVVVVALSMFLIVSALVLQNSNTRASPPPQAYEWQAKTVYLPQTSFELSTDGDLITVVYHFEWNDSYEFSSLNWSAVDKTKTDQLYVLGLGAKIWVTCAEIVSDFPIEITQGDGTSLRFVFNYTIDRETPHIYLTGERTYWKWDRLPNLVYDYRASGSCSIEDAWRNGTWSPEEGISLAYDPAGTLVLDRADFAVQLLVFDVTVPEFETIVPIAFLLGLAVLVGEKKRRAHQDDNSA